MPDSDFRSKMMDDKIREYQVGALRGETPPSGAQYSAGQDSPEVIELKRRIWERNAQKRKEQEERIRKGLPLSPP